MGWIFIFWGLFYIKSYKNVSVLLIAEKYNKEIAEELLSYNNSINYHFFLPLEFDNKIHHMIKKPNQTLYDSFNTLMFSKNSFILHKLITKINIYNNVKDLYGDILEFGVFKGASLALWLQLKKLYEPNSSTKIIGFDFFNCEELITLVKNWSCFFW